MKKLFVCAVLAALSLTACKESTQVAPAVPSSSQPAAVEPAPAAFPKITLSAQMQDMYDDTIAECSQKGILDKACVMEAFKDQERANALEDTAIRKGEGGPFVKTWLDDYLKHANGEPGKLSAYRQCQASAQGEATQLLQCALAELGWIYKHRERLVEYQDAATKALSKIPTADYNVSGG